MPIILFIRSTKVIIVGNYDLSDTKQQLSELIERLGDNYVGKEKHGIKSAYLDKESRQSIYRGWLGETGNRNPNTERGAILYKNVVQALERLSEDGEIKFSKTFKSVSEAKDYAQHMQGKVINAKSTQDIYNLMINEVKSQFGTELTLVGKTKLSQDTTIAFNTLLNKPDLLRNVLTKAFNDVLDSKITYNIAGNEQGGNIVKIDMTLRQHLLDLGLNVDKITNENVSAFYDSLLNASNDSKIKRVMDFYKRQINKLATQIKYYRNNSYLAIKSYKNIQSIKNKLDKHSLPTMKQYGDMLVPQLEYYASAVKSRALLSRKAKGISPIFVNDLVNNLRNYNETLTEKLTWLDYHPEIKENVDYLLSKFDTNGFPNRTLTLEETNAIFAVVLT